MFAGLNKDDGGSGSSLFLGNDIAWLYLPGF